MIVTLPGALHDCATSWSLSMIVKFPGFSLIMIVKLAGATFMDISMIVALPGPFIIVKLPGSSLLL